MKTFGQYIKEGGIYKEFEAIQITLDNYKDKKYKFTAMRHLTKRRVALIYNRSVDEWDVVILTGASNGVSIGDFKPATGDFVPNTSTKYGKELGTDLFRILLAVEADSDELAHAWEEAYMAEHPDVKF